MKGGLLRESCAADASPDLCVNTIYVSSLSVCVCVSQVAELISDCFSRRLGMMAGGQRRCKRSTLLSLLILL